MHTLRVASTLILLLPGAACFGKLPAREMFRLTLEPAPAAGSPMAAAGAGTGVMHAGPPPLAGGLAIEPYQTPGLYGDPGIVFRVGESQYGAYPSREWAIPLGQMLGMLTETVLAGHALAPEPPLFDPPSSRGHAYVWRGTVREFEEVNRGSTVFAAVRLDASIVRAGTDSLVWSGTAQLERPVPEGTMPAIVGALSQLARDAVAQLAAEARRSLARP